jgi:hypothetical protein
VLFRSPGNTGKRKGREREECQAINQEPPTICPARARMEMKRGKRRM